ncbi:hypothetical protein MFFC18_21440 [Mariniblastus fucicola]|uniref:Uncharacterized protein n=1 Tax=Mariniblastus fucicola TaxID=980251 RepID=A0A5B9P7G8_9BACT|nr:hypothetical protein MFFC18_21440 [Mariniblastus fucicola]
MLYKITQTLTTVFLASTVLSIVIPRDYGIYLLGISAICLALLIIFGALIFVGPKRWRETN